MTQERKIKISTDFEGLNSEQTIYKNFETKAQAIKSYYPAILDNIPLAELVKHHHVENLLKEFAANEIQLPIGIDEKIRLMFPNYSEVIKKLDELCSEFTSGKISLNNFDTTGHITDKALEDMETKHTFYAESKKQLRVYDIAKEIESRINELNEIFTENNKPKFYEYSQLHPTYIKRVGQFDINYFSLVSGL
jgi:hypothetical protein